MLIVLHEVSLVGCFRTGQLETGNLLLPSTKDSASVEDFVLQGCSGRPTMSSGFPLEDYGLSVGSTTPEGRHAIVI